MLDPLCVYVSMCLCVFALYSVVTDKIKKTLLSYWFTDVCHSFNDRAQKIIFSSCVN